MIFQDDAVFKGLRVCVSSLSIKKRILTTGCLVGLIWINSNAIDGSELRIRAQDDETLGHLKLTIHIPDKLNDGPKGAGIEVIAEGKKRALRDQGGNFLNYVNVDLEGNRASILTVEVLKGPEGRWPLTQVDVKIAHPDGRITYENLPIVKHYTGTFSAKYSNFTYYLPSRIKSVESVVRYGYPYNMELRDSIPIEQMPFFDAVSVFGAVWYVFDMYGKELRIVETGDVNARWNSRGVTKIYPCMTEQQYNSLIKPLLGKDYGDYFSNAFYMPIDNYHVLCFFPLLHDRFKSTGQSTDIAMHEGNHNVLNVLRPDLWNKKVTSKEIAAFHEFFADISTFFALASISEVATEIIRATRGNLETSSFFSVLGEPLKNRRDATSRTDLSQTPACESHAYSERWTRIFYGSLADAFNLRRTLAVSNNDGVSRSPIVPSPEQLLMNTAESLRRVFLKTVIQFPFDGFNPASFGRMLAKIAIEDSTSSFFVGFTYYNFAKQGIDLQDMIWSPTCKKPDFQDTAAAARRVEHAKWVCSSSCEPLSDAEITLVSSRLSAAVLTRSGQPYARYAPSSRSPQLPGW